MSVMNMYIILACFLYCVIFYLYMYIFDKINVAVTLLLQCETNQINDVSFCLAWSGDERYFDPTS